MKTKSFITLCIATALTAGAFTSCKNNAAETADDFYGTYYAVMPAADCPGIGTTVILDSNSTYVIEREYLECASAYRETGKYTVAEDILTLVSDENDTTYLKTAEGMIKWLDNGKNEITGELADAYILKPAAASAEITGNWIEPVPGMPEQFQGISFMEDGSAQSINMATLQYESWDRIGNVIFLKGKSIGNDQTIEFTDTLVITGITADSLKVARGGQETSYARQK